MNGQRVEAHPGRAAPELAARPVTVYEFTVTGTRNSAAFLDIDAEIRGLKLAPTSAPWPAI